MKPLLAPVEDGARASQIRGSPCSSEGVRSVLAAGRARVHVRVRDSPSGPSRVARGVLLEDEEGRTERAREGPRFCERVRARTLALVRDRGSRAEPRYPLRRRNCVVRSLCKKFRTRAVARRGVQYVLTDHDCLSTLFGMSVISQPRPMFSVLHWARSIPPFRV